MELIGFRIWFIALGAATVPFYLEFECALGMEVPRKIVMPGCVFSAKRREFDVDGFLAKSPWREFATKFYKGESFKGIQRPPRESSGFQFGISESDEGRLEPQTMEALEFLTEDRLEIERLRSFPGVEELNLRIGLFWREETLARFYSLPPEFMREGGELGVSVTLCIYAVSEGEGDE